MGGESSYYCTIPAPYPGKVAGKEEGGTLTEFLVGVYRPILQSKGWRTGWTKIPDQNSNFPISVFRRPLQNSDILSGLGPVSRKSR